jgi:hypothetical protein
MGFRKHVQEVLCTCDSDTYGPMQPEIILLSIMDVRQGRHEV